jgi:hypothetical protein
MAFQHASYAKWITNYPYVGGADSKEIIHSSFVDVLLKTRCCVKEGV